MICACQEFGLGHDIQRYLSVMPVRIFRQVIIAAGCPVEFLGPIRKLASHRTAAAYVSVSADVLATVRRRLDVCAPVLMDKAQLVA